MKLTHNYLQDKNLSESTNGRGSSNDPVGSLHKKISVKLRRLKKLLRAHDRCSYAIGDLCIDLMDTHRLSLSYICRKTGYSAARISEMHLTARTFPPPQREGFSFQDSLMARRIAKRMRSLTMTPLEIRKEIARLPSKRFRDVRTHFVQKMICRERNKSLASSVGIIEGSNDLLNRCHHGDWQDVVPLLPDRSVKLFLCDPPFGGYSWMEEGGYISGRSKACGLRVDCDNNNDEDALAATLSLFDLCLPKLASGGVLLLFQPGGRPDRPEILQTADEAGWRCQIPLTWLKGSNGAGSCTRPYAPSTERILVFTRKNESLRCHESGLARSDVLDFPSVIPSSVAAMDQGRLNYGSIHIFQKPPALCRFLIEKHTYPGDLVVDPFGCSGVSCIEAANLGRNWVYIESNEANFAWGSQCVAEAISAQAVG